MTVPLLRTKLYIPPLRQGVLSRPRLINQLNAGLVRKLTLISAPAGFGKTTLLSEWIAALQLPRVAWLSLDEGDNETLRFWTYLVVALKTVAPGIGEMTLALLETPPAPSLFTTSPSSRLAEKLFAPVVGSAGSEIALESSLATSDDRSTQDARRGTGVVQAAQPDRTEAALTALINEIAAARPDETCLPLILVLDDYHLIENPAIHAGMTFLLDHLPPTGELHLVIASRTDPPLSLSRLRGRGELNELSMADIRFTPDEASAFLNQMMRLGLSAQDVIDLERRTEGWIVGLQMAALAILGRSSATIDQVRLTAPDYQPFTTTEFIHSLTGGDRYIMDYLTDEVLLQQPADVQDFLLRTSILERFCSPLCDAVCVEETSVSARFASGGRTAQEMLERLEAANLFIVPMDDERKWFRYHHLFAELLHQRLDRRYPELASALHLRASKWYEQEGLVDQAISHALATTDYDYAASLIQQHAGDAFARGEFKLVLGWLKALPEELIHSHPLLCIIYAYSTQGDLAQMEGWIEAAQKSLAVWSHGVSSPDEDPRTYDTVIRHLAVLRALTARVHGEPMAKVIELIQNALEIVPESDPGTRSLLVMQQAIEYLNAGDYIAGEPALVEAARLGERGGFPYTTLAAIYLLGMLERRRGELRDVACRCRKSLASIIEPVERSGRRMPVGGFIYLTLGCVLAEWNDFSNAEVALAKGLESARLLPMEIAPLEGYFALARMRIAQNDYERMPDLDDMVAQNEGIFKGIAKTIRVRVWLMRSPRKPQYLEPALRWAAERQLEPQEWDWDIYEQLTRARAFILQSRAAPPVRGQPDLGSVVDFLEAQLRIVEGQGMTQFMIDTLIVQALAFQVLGREEQSLNAIGRALTLAEPGGYIRIFLDEGLPMERLLYQAAQRGIHPEYAGKLLAADEATPVKGPDATLWRPAARVVERPSPVRPGPLVEPLTARETEVLRLLAEGLSNGEIARRLFISLSTVKRHNATIYGKLVVNTRTQAVARGRELGLV